LGARLRPLRCFVFWGAVTLSTGPRDGLDGEPDVTSARIEGGVRVYRTWVSAGFMTRDTAQLLPLRVFDTAYVTTSVGLKSGGYVAIRGPIYKAIGVDIIATKWGSSDAYRPLRHARSEINLVTRWLSRFPSGNFGIHAAMVHEYRGLTQFPVKDGFVRTTEASNVFSGLLEIRILRGIITYQVRNLTAKVHQIVPDFYMHRTVNLYGVRWEFWN
jgi:hypothetical protein